MIFNLFLNIDNHYYLTLSTPNNYSLINRRRYRIILPAGCFRNGCAHHIPDILRIHYLVGSRTLQQLKKNIGKPEYREFPGENIQRLLGILKYVLT